MVSSISPTIGRWFPPETVTKNPPFLDKIRAMIRATPVNGFIGCAAALADHDYATAVATVKHRVLFMTGEKDAATAPMRTLHEKLAGSQFVELKGAGHISNMERPDEASKAIRDFIGSH